MYASHRSYVEHAHLGHQHADLLVDLVKQRHAAGLYGARITGGGCGGTVAVLMEATPQADEAVAEILVAYEERTSRRPTLLAGSSPGARTFEAVL
jgi:L-arabinokinase